VVCRPRCPAEVPRRGDYLIIEQANRRCGELPEAAGPEAEAQHLARAFKAAREDLRVDAVDMRAVRLEGQVHVRVRQDRLLVRWLAVQVPADDPEPVDQAGEAGLRVVPGQRKPPGRTVRAQDAPDLLGCLHGPQRSRWPGTGRARTGPLSCLFKMAHAGAATVAFMNLHPQLADAAEAAVRVVDGVTPAQFGDPTPCTDWDVRALLNHLILWTSYSLERRAHGQSVSEELMATDFAASPDFAAAYRAQLDRALAAWADPAAWDRKLDVMGEATPASDVAALNLAELILHGWDLAVATGQEYTVSDGAATAALAAVEANADLFRQYQGFAAEVPVMGSASALRRTLGLSGRNPHRG
jgi:uncharacterized protein (TIGR03086 family)